MQEISRVFRADTKALIDCDAIVAVLEGPIVDDGVAWELGFGYAQGKPCIGLVVDDRYAMSAWRNPMVYACLSEQFDRVSMLVEFLKNAKHGQRVLTR